MECASRYAAGTADILTAQFGSWEGGEGGGFQSFSKNSKIHLFLWSQVSMSALEIVFQIWGLGLGIYQRLVSSQI